MLYYDLTMTGLFYIVLYTNTISYVYIAIALSRTLQCQRAMYCARELQ